MPRPTRIVVDLKAGKRTVVELTDTELAQVAIDKAAWDVEFSKRQAEETRKREREAAIDRLIAGQVRAPT